MELTEKHLIELRNERRADYIAEANMEAQFKSAELEQKMEYLFYIEGLNREVWQPGASSKYARAALLKSLTEAEQNAVVQIECIDERETEIV